MERLRLVALPDSYYLNNLNGEVRTDTSKSHNDAIKEGTTSSDIFGVKPKKVSNTLSAEQDNFRGYIKLAKPVLREFITERQGKVLAKILGVPNKLIQQIYDFIVVMDKHTGEFVKVSEISGGNAEDYYMYAEIYQHLIENFDYEEAIRETLLTVLAQNVFTESATDIGEINRNGVGINLVQDYYFQMNEAARKFLKKEIETIEDIEFAFKQAISKGDTRLYYLLNTNKETLECCITRVISCLPMSMRPSIDGRQDQFTLQYSDIIGANTKLKDTLNTVHTLREVNDCYRVLAVKVKELTVNSNEKKETRFSVAEKLKGKKGFIRNKVMGKRSDYTGRSVVVINPELQLDEIALPVDMIPKVFRHHHMKALGNTNSALSLLKKTNAELTDEIVKLGILDNIRVCINRAPTLHSLSYLSYKVKVSKSKAIEVNPLVCEGFNMDFDGDTAAVNVPITDAGIIDTNTVMFTMNNLFKPATGACTLKPRLEMIYGLNTCTLDAYLKEDVGTFVSSEIEYQQRLLIGDIQPTDTRVDKPDGIYIYKNQPTHFSSHKELEEAIYASEVKLGKHCVVDGLGSGPAGHLLVKGVLPAELRDSLKEINKKSITGLIDSILPYGVETFKTSVHALCTIGFKIATLYPPTISILDPIDRDIIHKPIAEFKDSMLTLTELFENGFEEEEAYNVKFSTAFSEAEKKIKSAILPALGPRNGFRRLVESGARGDDNNLLQIYSHKGRIARAQGDPFTAVIENSYTTQLSPLEHFISAYGARKGIIDKSIKPGDTGYAERLMWHTTQDIHIIAEDCGTSEGITIRKSDLMDYDRTGADEAKLQENAEANLIGMITGRYEAKTNRLITEKLAKELAKNSEVVIRSPITCKNLCCSKCYGTDLAIRGKAVRGTPVGFIAAQSIGEPGTQLTMKSFQKGGVAGRGDVGSDFDRVSAAIKMEGVAGKAKFGNYDPLAWAVGPIKESPDAKDNTKKTIRIGNSSKSKRVDINAQLKSHISYVGESICQIPGELDINEILRYRGVRAAQMHILYTCYFAYLNNATVNNIHFELLTATMKLFLCLKSNKPDFKVGQFYTQQEILAKGSTLGVEFTEVLKGVKSVPLVRESAMSTIQMERNVQGITRAVLVGNGDNLVNPLQALMFGLEPKIGSTYPNYIEERLKEAYCKDEETIKLLQAGKSWY